MEFSVRTGFVQQEHLRCEQESECQCEHPRRHRRPNRPLGSHPHLRRGAWRRRPGRPGAARGEGDVRKSLPHNEYRVFKGNAGFWIGVAGGGLLL